MRHLPGDLGRRGRRTAKADTSKIEASADPAAGEGASRYVHSRSRQDDGEHDFSLDIASEASTNYIAWIADLCRPHLGRRVLDLGAGYGVITEQLAPGRDVVALDMSDACVAAMQIRFRGSANVRVVQGDLRQLDLDDRFDSIVMFNVLEHIFDEQAVLESCIERLVPGGNIIIYVPAVNRLYTDWDRKVGHFRRYSKGRLAGVLQEANLRPDELRYINFFAMGPWMLSGLLTTGHKSYQSSLEMWDRTGTVLSRALEQRVRMPVGLNLFTVARPVSTGSAASPTR